MKKEIIVNSTQYETRVALLEGGKLVELTVKGADDNRIVSNIFKGKIKTVLPGMQAAFVDIGMEKAAFLHSSDIGKLADGGHYDADDDEEAPVDIIRKTKRAGIETVLKEGQEVLVQVIKEPISTKGPRVSTEISLAGRYVVMVPDDHAVRVSKKISDWAEKKRLRSIVRDMRPEGFGFIVRTEGEGRSESDFKADIKRLLKYWTQLTKRADRLEPPALLHQEMSMITGIIRDIYSDDIESLVVDNRAVYREIVSFVREIAPALKGRVKLYKEKKPIFDAYNIEPDIEKMIDRKVWIKKGAYLIIDQTEAMVTIDVNTGRFVGRKDQETTIFRTNIDAAREVARQVRLRDIGGLIVIDFIDMYNRENRRKLYDEYCYQLRNDRAKRAVSPVSDFGLIEMTRERIRPSLMTALSDPCPHCDGLGRVLSKQTMSTKVERWFQRAKASSNHKRFNLIVNPDLADHLTNGGGNRVAKLSNAYRFHINLVRDTTLSQQKFIVMDMETSEDLTKEFFS
ncbi:MAG: Rne/Rng family ribonuclease [candidate division Zixibacteria bacterium]|nr:Rne/Rng family ribonuclease [candidate division Zixibacteria bacterium]